MDPVAFRPVGGVQSAGQLGRVQTGQIANRLRFFAERHNPVDSPLVGTRPDIESGQALGWNPARVLDDKAVHVNNPQRAVRSGPRLHRAEPVVLRGEKLVLLFVRRAIAPEGNARRFEHEPMHQVVHRLTDECIAVIVRSQQLGAINAQTARRGRAAGRAGIVESFEHPASGKSWFGSGSAGTNTRGSGGAMCGLRSR